MIRVERKRQPLKKTCLMACLAMFVTACASIQLQAKQELTRASNCKTAEQVIAILQSEEALVVQEIVAGAQSIEPATAVTRILGDHYRDGADVPTVRYENDIDAKIVEITQKCGLQLPGNAWRDNWDFVG